MLRFIKNESGASAAEYSVILAIIGSGLSFAAIGLGGSISDAVGGAGTCIETAGVTCDTATAGGGSGNGGGSGSETPPATETPPTTETPPATGTPPGQSGSAPGQSGATPGQGGTPPGQGGTPPGQDKDKEKEKEK